jgi:arabinogalactan oligomer/maltooligosaccharide transport system permease protein
VNAPKRTRFLTLLSLTLIALGAAALLWFIFSSAPEPVRKGFFLVLPGGWQRLLAVLVTLGAALAGGAYAYGRLNRPGRARQYAAAMGTHLLIWVMILAASYPVLYLLAVSLNRNNTLAGALPRAGNLLVRSGVLPDPAGFSLVQYQKVLSQTHLLPWQWLLVGLLLLALLGAAGTALLKRRSGRFAQLDGYQRFFGWTLFLLLAALVVSISPAQFYSVTEAGQRVPASSERMIILYIRNTLLISGTTGLFSVLIATTAGYAFARMRFEGRYPALLTFVFVQMFPGFMALVAIFYLMSYLDLINTFTGLILAYSGGAIAFSAWIFKGYLESISPSLEEQAMVDGASRWGAFWRIILPLSIPMLLFIFLLQFIGTYSEFILANTLLLGQENWTVGIGLRNFTTGRFDTQWGALSASAVLGSLPILILFYAFQDALTGQDQSGSVSG